MGKAGYVAVDWGTSSFRLWLMDRAGAVMDERRSSEGMMVASKLGFAAVLQSHLDAVGAGNDLPVVICGMAGARQGWVEAGYIDTPAQLAAILSGAVAAPGLSRDVRILPGIAQRDPDAPDVMRGEETQICGVLAELSAQPQTVCLPGTHSKLATVANGRVERFATAMTGELFELLCSHSVLGRLMQPGEHEADAFAQGVAHAAQAGDLLHHLFAVRTLGLFDALRPTQLRPFLSGLLIGHELRSVPRQSGVVYVLGAEALAHLYVHALRTQGYEPRLLDPDAVVTGLSRLASLARA